MRHGGDAVTPPRPLWLFLGLPAPASPEAETESLPFAALDSRLATDPPPAVIVMPLIGQGFDAIEACQRLSAAGFAGEVVIRAPALPNRKLIQRELAQAGRSLKITLSGPQT
jgi:hypothetical protein